MDIREASAMTEASGLTNDTGRLVNPSERAAGPAKEMDSRRPAPRISTQLRKMTLEAPLHSLLVAFLLGILVARRR